MLCGSSDTTAGSCFVMQNLTTMLGTLGYEHVIKMEPENFL
jgi:hypothetical protein